MDELKFKDWMSKNGAKSKIISDTISRLKRLEKELGFCDLDDEYRSDLCCRILSSLEHNGENEIMRNFPKTSLPIGKYSMSTFRCALKKYINFRLEMSNKT